MHDAEYWAQRAKIMQDAILNGIDDEYVKNLQRQYDIAVADIEKEIRAWYQRFADNNQISYADAQKLLNTEELAEFKWTVQEYIRRAQESKATGAWVKELENASARVHVSRLESIKLQLRQHAETLVQERIKATESAAKLAYVDSYSHTAYEVQRGIGVGCDMRGIDTARLDRILARPWTADNQTFRARCWTDKAKLIQSVNQELTRMVATGDAPDKAIKAISHSFRVSEYNAVRLVMTESAYFATEAQKDCFNELGVERYTIIGALDTRTCAICGSMDGKVFKMSEFKVGVTAPIFHPRCRCCTAPYYEDMDDLGSQLSRDEDSYPISRNTTYEQWKKMQDAKYGAGTVDKMRKMGYNENADREQFERYKGWLGSNALKTFDAFQQIKYGDGYAALKVQYADARIQDQIKTGKLNTTVQEGKQGKHLKWHNNFIEGRSYLNATEDVQALVSKYAGTGVLVRDASGKWAHKEVVKADHPVGFAVSQVDGTTTETSTFTIHYSKNGVHIVPKRE